MVDIALLAAILAAVRRGDTYRSLFNWTWVLVGVQLLTVWAGAVIWPDRAFLHTDGLIPVRINGVLPSLDQNEVGEYGAVLAIVALSRLLGPRRGQGRIFHWLLFGFGLVTLAASQTRAAIAGFLLGSVLVLFFSKRFRVIAFLGLAVVLIFAATNASDLGRKLWERGEDPEAVQGMSGRLAVWESGWTKVSERPLTGYGAYAGGRFVVDELPGLPSGANVLNFYLETVLGTGVCGLALLAVALLGTWGILVREWGSASVRGSDRQLVVEAIGVLALMTLRSFFGTQLMWHPSLNFLLILGYAEFLRRREKRESVSWHIRFPLPRNEQEATN